MVEIIEVYEEGGVLYVTTKFLETHYKTSTRNIGNWIKKGLPKYKLKGVLSNVFIWAEVQEWHEENINKAKSRAGKTSRESNYKMPKKEENKEKDVKDLDIRETIIEIKQEIKRVDIEGLPQNYINELISNMEKLTKLELTLGDLIHKKDTEKTIIEYAAILISGYRRDIKLLPGECKNRTEDEIRTILEKTYRANIAKIQRIAKSDKLSDKKIIEIIDMATILLFKEKGLEEILSKMKELL